MMKSIADLDPAGRSRLNDLKVIKRRRGHMLAILQGSSTCHPIGDRNDFQTKVRTGLRQDVITRVIAKESGITLPLLDGEDRNDAFGIVYNSRYTSKLSLRIRL